MKKKNYLLVGFYFFVFVNSVDAQIRLDVQGDAKIRGKLDLVNADGKSSIFIGVNAGINDNGFFHSGDNENTFIGTNAGQSNTFGFQNTFLGKDAGNSNTDGDENTFVGMNAGISNDSGLKNTFLGKDAGNSNTDGNENTFIGMDAGKFSTIGSSNTFVGRNAGLFNVEGFQNTYLGVGAGASSNDNGGTRNTFLGYNATSQFTPGFGGSPNQAIAIGYEAKVECDNCAVIGGTGANSINLGIGTSNPRTRLSINPFNVEAKIGLYHGGSQLSHLGFGISNIGIFDHQLNYHIQTTNDAHVFWAGGKNGDGTELMRMRGNGSVNISNLPTGTNIKYFVMIDESGDLFKVDFQLLQSTKIIKDLQEKNKKLEAKVAELESLILEFREFKELTEKLLSTQKGKDKVNSYTLPLEQRARLSQNQPNPFNQSTVIKFFLPNNVQNAKIQVTSIDGTVLSTVKIQETGKGQVTINASIFPAGTYYYSLLLDGKTVETKRMVLTR